MSSVNPRTSYHLEPDGRIFTETRMEVLGPKGESLGFTPPQRVPYEPLRLFQTDPEGKKPGPLQIVDTDLADHPDEKLKQLAALHWTPEIKAAHRARLAAEISPPAARKPK
jgi:hypothetical protein